jgi:hypothetical protein
MSVPDQRNECLLSQREDVSLFIGILPGATWRQVVLFPEGTVLADIRETEIKTGGYAGPDQGMVAASALIGLFRLSGWYVDEMPHAGAVWMKPCIADDSEDVAEDGGKVAGDSPARS